MDVSIIIVNYYTSNLINNCLRSIVDQTIGVDYEVIIVDNNSELLGEKIVTPVDLKPKYIQLPENVGFGGANNEGVKIAQGKNILFLNPDTVILNNAIKILSDVLDNNKGCAACGGNLYDEDLNPALSYRRIFPGVKWHFNELLHLIPEKLLYGNNRSFNNSEEPSEVAYITGADLMVKKIIFNQLAGFSQDFFMYYEETDLCYRLRKLGYSILSVPQAKIQHLEGKSFFPAQNEKKISIIEKSRHLFYKRNLSVVERTFSNLLYNFFLFTRVKLCKDATKRNYYKTRLKYYHKYLDR